MERTRFVIKEIAGNEEDSLEPDNGIIAAFLFAIDLA